MCKILLTKELNKANTNSIDMKQIQEDGKLEKYNEGIAFLGGMYQIKEFGWGYALVSPKDNIITDVAIDTVKTMGLHFRNVFINGFELIAYFD